MMKVKEHNFTGVYEQLEYLQGAISSSILLEQFPVLGTDKESKVCNKKY